ncbi:class I SAM-dependent methyltransferase [Pseudogemmobacter bohemicus]|uniref:class I SAM-dependent methyltransferase n=1 Tax=Pseudogemmobacter bohemicus TaxID=2250708 RepID=UPI000DD42A23|nr:class I SAM-dependent methyltransferase [Pseudogemmobacter bohemicus]
MKRRYRISKDADIRADILARTPEVGDLLDIYVGNEGPVVNKWHHYLALYERYFAKWRGGPVRFLEIGVSKGGSLDIWRRFLGPEAVIFGIDIDPACAQFNGKSGQVRIGSQDNPAFLKKVVDEMGGLDLVLDDGSHVMKHIKTSLAALFPRLSPGGTYVIEDLHTAYWEEYGGGLENTDNFFAMIRPLIDDMHRWYHEGALNRRDLRDQITGIHIHDSLVVLDKGKVTKPVHSFVGAEATEKRRKSQEQAIAAGHEGEGGR